MAGLASALKRDATFFRVARLEDRRMGTRFRDTAEIGEQVDHVLRRELGPSESIGRNLRVHLLGVIPHALGPFERLVDFAPGGDWGAG